MGESKRTLYEFIGGITMLCFIGCCFGFFISEDPGAFILGEIYGSLCAVGLVMLLYRSLDKALDMDSEAATSYSRKQTFFRLILMVAVLALAIAFHKYISVLAAFMGLMNLKFGAYLVPLIHKFINTK